MKTINNSIDFLLLLIVTVSAQILEDHHYNTKFQNVISYQKIETDYQV